MNYYWTFREREYYLDEEERYMADPKEPVPGQTGGQFDSSTWREEAAKLFSDRFRMGGKESGNEAFALIASGKIDNVVEGLRRLPDVSTRFVALQTFLELNAARPPVWSPEQIDGFLKQAKSSGLFDSSEWRKEAADIGKLVTDRRAKDVTAQAEAVKGVLGHLAPAPIEIKPVAPTTPTPKVG